MIKTFFVGLMSLGMLIPLFGVGVIGVVVVSILFGLLSVVIGISLAVAKLVLMVVLPVLIVGWLVSLLFARPRPTVD